MLAFSCFYYFYIYNSDTQIIIRNGEMVVVLLDGLRCYSLGRYNCFQAH